MAQSVNISQIVNGTLYADGTPALGKVEETKLPDVAMKMASYIGMGMLGEFELPVGFEKMTTEFKVKSIYEDLTPIMCDPYTYVPLQIRSNVEIWDGAGRRKQVPFVTHMLVLFTAFPLSATVKMAARQEFTAKASVHQVKQVLNGKTLFELDLLNGKLVINGVDRSAEVIVG
jgi:P2 family phage contractile tail tube protein